jgi:hypothetical protein
MQDDAIMDRVDGVFDRVIERYLEEVFNKIDSWLATNASDSGRIEVGEGKRPWIIKVELYGESGERVETMAFDLSILAGVIIREAVYEVRELVDDRTVATAVATILMKSLTLHWDLRDILIAHIDQWLVDMGWERHEDTKVRTSLCTLGLHILWDELWGGQDEEGLGY